MLAIKTENLTKKFKDLTAVNELNLEIEENELYALLGVNGAGKSTTIRMLSCILKPTAGDAFILGKSINKEPLEVKKMIGVSLQETAVAGLLSVKENIELLCGIYGYSKEKTKSKLEELVDAFGLREVLNKRANKLSGGYQRRLSIAMGLISEPKVLFLDEPTLGLDVIVREELWELIKELKSKMTIILTTHYMEEAEALSDHIGIMKDGKLVAEGTCLELKQRANEESFEKAFIKIIKESK